MKVGALGFYRDAKRVLGLVVGETAPGGRIPGENDRALIFAGNHVEAVSAFGQRLALDGHWIHKLNGRVLIRSGAPDLAVRHDSAPDFALVHHRTVVVDGDVGDPNPLGDDRMLTGPRQIQNERLGLSQ